MKSIYLIIALLAAANATASPSDDVHVVSSSLLPARANEGEVYWTDKRMRLANERVIPALSKAQFERLAAFPDSHFSKMIEPTIIASSDPLPTDHGRSVSQADVSQRPFSSSGKLFFTEPGDFGEEADSFCSAAFVGNPRIIMTAAHCLMDPRTGEFYKNFYFVQGYANGGGVGFTPSGGSVLSTWKTGESMGNLKVDYGFLETTSDSAAGWLGLWFHPQDAFSYSSWVAIGYPYNYSHGQYLQKVNGSLGGVTNGIVQMLGNTMQHGSSGGPWIGSLTTAEHLGGNYAIGLNSFGRIDFPNSEFGPLFDVSTFYLYKTMVGW